MSKGTQTIYVEGVVKWPRVYQDQMDTKYGDKFHITLYPDEAGIHLLKSSGSRLKWKEDEDGSFVKITRDNMKNFKGKEEILGPPKVIDKDNNPFSLRIGNGSKVTAKVSVYDSAFGKGTRLEAVRVDEYVPPPESDQKDELYPF